MNNTTIYNTLKENIVLNSLLFAIISSIIYWTFVSFLFIERVGDYDDMAFDTINTIESKISHEPTQRILVFEIDDIFLKKQNLMDSNNLLNKNYNDFLPRKYLIDFIQKTDQINPKLLFIDLNLNNKKQQLEDKKLINLLKKKRNYPIFFTHNTNSNFIEVEKIEGVYFVSTKLAVSFDNKIRQYYSYLEREDTHGELKKYYFAPLVFLGMDTSKLTKDYNVVNNRFIYKDRFTDQDSIEKSYWKNINFYSFDTDIISLRKDNTENSIIFLGTNHSDKNNNDIHTLYNGSKVSGIEILANILASTYYFSPQLKLLPTNISIFLIFLITFLARIISLTLLGRSFLSLLFFLITAIAINFLISYLIFKLSHYWINYITTYIPYALYNLIATLINTLKHLKMIYINIKERIKIF